jgi:glycerol-1-phosphate dehydrogenase [NAD(P)+]
MKEITSKIPSMEECLSEADDTEYMIVKEGAFEEIPSVLTSYYCDNGKKDRIAMCFADTNTFAAAGKAVEEILREPTGGSRLAGITLKNSFIFEEGLHAEYKHVETIKSQLKTILDNPAENQSVLVPVAVGSGTINDLVKRASDELNLPYLCIPTAASVDGYTAYGAALLYEGFKQTMACKAPLAVIADSNVLAEAPAYLSSSGFGDLAGKIIAGTDWIIADHVFELDGKGELVRGTAAIDSTAWTMV